MLVRYQNSSISINILLVRYQNIYILCIYIYIYTQKHILILLCVPSLTLRWLCSEVLAKQWTDLVCVHVSPLVTLDTAHVPHFNTKRLVSNRLISLRIPHQQKIPYTNTLTLGHVSVSTIISYVSVSTTTSTGHLFLWTFDLPTGNAF